MKMMGKRFISVLIVAVSFGDSVYCQESFFQKSVTWLVQGGIKHGSIVGRDKVDGLTGATKTQWSAYAGAEFKIKGHYFQTGLNLGATDQYVNYFYPPMMDFVISGERDISMVLLDIPLLYDFHFYRYKSAGREKSRLAASLGGFLSCVLSKEIDSRGVLPPESMSGWAIGPFFRLAYYPLDFGRVQPGLFFDFYRSIAPKYFYDDPYFQQNGIAGQLGTLNFGISLWI